MRFSLTVIDGRIPHQAQRVDIMLDLDPDQPLGEVMPNFLEHLGEQVHPSFATRVLIWVDGRPADPSSSVRASGLRPGAVVELFRGSLAARAPRGVSELRVVGGSGAGRVHRIGLGETTVGCGAPGLSLPDLRLSADALRVTARPDGSLLVLAETGLSATLANEPLLGSTAWPVGEYLVAGETVLEHAPLGVEVAEVLPAADHTGRDVVRPPRLLPQPREVEFTLPNEPGERPKQAIPWLMVGAPLLMIIPMYFMMGPRSLVFGLMSPVMALANFFASRKGSRKQYAEQKAKYEKDLADVQARIELALIRERNDRRSLAPDPATVLLTAMSPGRRLWERRRTDPDYLVLRLGLAELPAQLVVKVPQRDASKEAPPERTLAHIPAGLAIRQLGVIGISGSLDARYGVARWVVGQLAVLHSPRDLRMVLLTDEEQGPHWSWVRWLPHFRDEDEILPAAVGTDQQSLSRRLAELTQQLANRQAAQAKSSTSSTRNALPPGPDLVVVLDGGRRMRSLPGVVQLLREGPAVGIYAICLDAQTRQLPEECAGLVDILTDVSQCGRINLRQTRAAEIRSILPDLVEVTWAERIARALAPLRDTTPDVEETGLPKSARLLDDAELEPPTVEKILSRWVNGRTTDVIIGAGFDGVFRFDLRRDGPHALIAGTTGSGKSELLQTMVASLAIANRADQLTFVLVDYKGGSAFKECAKLPHTVGMVTDLDNHLVSRALVSLGAELRRREHLLVGPGAKDLEDYWALCAKDPSLPTVPRLVLVIDEFASLVAELPDFVKGLVSIAQRGRSLGIHLVLATQRPTGVVSADIRANTNLRISLRVTDEAESRDVIDAPDAAWITRATPGRGYIRTGHSSLMPFQTGRVGGRRPDLTVLAPQAAPTPLAWPVSWAQIGQPVPLRPKAQQVTTDEGETDLSILVGVIGQAHERARVPDQPSPWLPPLTTEVTLPQLQAAAPAEALDVGLPPPAAWLLQDEPADQSQSVGTFGLGRDSHLYVVGGPRSGRSTALRTLITSLAENVPVADLHVYGLDCGNGALLALGELPHTGAIVQRTQLVRASRLLHKLTEEVAQRQEVLGAQGFADIGEQRRSAAPELRLPYLVLVLDRWEGFVSAMGELDGGYLTEVMINLIKEGASAGLHIIVSGDRSLASSRMSSLVEARFAMRLPSRDDYSAMSISPRNVPDQMPDGRGLWADSEREAQVAILAGENTGAGQAAAISEIGERLAERDSTTPEQLLPFRLEALPTMIPVLDVIDRAGPESSPLDEASPFWMPFGLGGDDFTMFGHDLEGSPLAVVMGIAKSGRTNTLRFAAEIARRRGQYILAVCPRINALSKELTGREDAYVLTGVNFEGEELIEALRDTPDGSLVLIDDGDMVRDGTIGAALRALMGQARTKELHVITAGQTTEFGSNLTGWLYEARKARQGLVLSPTQLSDGDVLGAKLARTDISRRVTPGRGLLCFGGLDPVTIQVPFMG